MCLQVVMKSVESFSVSFSLQQALHQCEFESAGEGGMKCS